jgi:hypothetical protein
VSALHEGLLPIGAASYWFEVLCGLASGGDLPVYSELVCSMLHPGF